MSPCYNDGMVNRLLSRRIKKSAVCAWHTLTPAAALKALATTRSGLTEHEVKLRLERDGLNSLPDAPPPTWAEIVLRQFTDPLIVVLMVSAAAVAFIGDHVDAIVIAVVLLLNAIIGAYQGGKAEGALRSLKRFTKGTAAVLRGGRTRTLVDVGIVLGDIIVLAEGDRVPADGRLIEVRDLAVDEALLTGESMAVEKQTEALARPKLPVHEQKCMVFKGTAVTRGRALAVVTATGTATAIGTIAHELEGAEQDTPLKVSIKRLSRGILWGIGIIVSTTYFVGIGIGVPAREMFAGAVAIAVSAVPSGLPIVVTVVLAVGVTRMAKRHALVKRLQAVEALGRVNVLAVDKTGTLTLNEMRVQEAIVEGKRYAVGGLGYEPTGFITHGKKVVEPHENPGLMELARLVTRSSTAIIESKHGGKQWHVVSGDPTEAAMITFGAMLGFDRATIEAAHPVLREYPFHRETKYHAAIHDVAGVPTLSVAGAPEAIMEKVVTYWQRGGCARCGIKEREWYDAQVRELSEKGLRVIAVGRRENAPLVAKAEEIDELCLVGLLGIADSLRASAVSAIRDIRATGIKVVMITGDHPLTARAIAKSVGIAHDPAVLTGLEIEEADDKKLLELVPSRDVFARVTPEHKLRIVKALRENGDTVAMTGDGVNDALSLVGADLGIAMGGEGTEVAREAADIVLVDGNLSTLGAAVEEGRSITISLKQVLLYLFSTSIGELLFVVGALFVGSALPITASQIIWLNFVTDGILVIPLVLEPKLARSRESGPIRSRSLIDTSMALRIFLMSVTMVGATALFVYILGDIVQGALLQTAILTALAASQWWNAWNCRSRTASIASRRVPMNWYLLGATTVAVLMHVVITTVPTLQRVFGTVAMDARLWFLAIAFAGTIVLMEEIRKFIVRHAQSSA
ncbi:MAG: hypothetical protein COV10_03315 [Candidatus Vogelbacteria bacterium CG10_big_fil_rev_8_21_14_0_10_51_16]|uniref:Cation-transporting P-type ATPase N-terminal domain-containing protein n=1 Tax=Candidatus Vogelbacteria bacterium CG10_big_fil_rev_8_21_14_0_10_51_16 TaxID=1975045 RepID=A0A2H0RE84_9BACT|nr:MAG: hypothetical protein COV10_03315 [Candidatus Vogelbacteria bacterium CG10_big_fil_rev_8_21_14_0_10_51_16]